MNIALLDYAKQSPVKLTKPEMNLISLLSLSYGVKVNQSETGMTVLSNRFTGENATVTNLVAALVEFIYACETVGPVTYHGKKVPVSVYDRTRYLVLKLHPEAYRTLID